MSEPKAGGTQSFILFLLHSPPSQVAPKHHRFNQVHFSGVNPKTAYVPSKIQFFLSQESFNFHIVCSDKFPRNPVSALVPLQPWLKLIPNLFAFNGEHLENLKFLGVDKLVVDNFTSSGNPVAVFSY